MEGDIDRGGLASSRWYPLNSRAIDYIDIYMPAGLVARVALFPILLLRLSALTFGDLSERELRRARWAGML
jgi:hypothetical protein